MPAGVQGAKPSGSCSVLGYFLFSRMASLKHKNTREIGITAIGMYLYELCLMFKSYKVYSEAYFDYNINLSSGVCNVSCGA